jgi:S-adenosylmethionine:tRNA ribosyltransferase-isomerase
VDQSAEELAEADGSPGARVDLAPVTLHTGVSSLEQSERPLPERFRVPAATARLVNAVHGWNGRVIAVGTTVARALETVAAAGGTASEGGAGRVC